MHAVRVRQTRLGAQLACIASHHNRWELVYLECSSGCAHAASYRVVRGIVHGLEQEAIGFDVENENHCLVELLAGRGIEAVGVPVVVGAEAREVHGPVTFIGHDHACQR